MTADISVDISTGPVWAIPIPATLGDLTLLTADAILYGWSIREAGGETPISAEGSVTAPAAGGAIATTPALALGTYTVNWTVQLAGTPGVGDANNFGLFVGATQVATSVNQGAVDDYPQPPFEVQVGFGQTVAVKAIGVGTAGAIYSAQVALTPTTPTDAVVELQDVASPLAEVSIPANGAASEWLGPIGVRVYGQIKLHVVAGTVTGAVYAGFAR